MIISDRANLPVRASAPGRSSDAYFQLLCGVLLGYALLGKGFAYLGFPPIFIGEIALLTGAVIVVRTGCLVAALTTLPSLVLAAAMALVTVRTLPFVGPYGLDALRDSVVVMYGAFAFIVIALLLEDRRRVGTILRYYGVFLKVYLSTIPILFTFQRYMPNLLPNLPGTDVFWVQLRPGEIAVHLAGIVVFALVGFHRMTRLWATLAIALLAVMAALSRGPMLAEILPITFAALVLGKFRKVAAMTAAGLMIFCAAYAVEPLLFDYVEAASSAERSISTRQIVENVASIVGQSGQQGEDTKVWRLYWWDIIIADTVFGPDFWTGRGFGLNLADADGFQVGDQPGDPPLRSPHNVHMTMLARAGVPGVALWLLVIASWFGMVMRTMRTATRQGHTEWAGLFLFAGCYVMSIIINATFDVALEGPMQGIWFWCLIGFGIGSVMIYRYRSNTIFSSATDGP